MRAAQLIMVFIFFCKRTAMFIAYFMILSITLIFLSKKPIFQAELAYVV